MSFSALYLVNASLLLYLAGMIQVWAWLIGRLIRKRSLNLPVFVHHERPVPWGIGTIILVIVLYLGTHLLVTQAYLFSTGRVHRENAAAGRAIPAHTPKASSHQATEPESSSIPASRSNDGPLESSRTASPTEDSLLSVTEGMFLLTLINELLIVLIPLLLRKTSNANAADYGFDLHRWGFQIKIGIAGALFIAPLVYLIQFLATRIWTSHEHPVQDMIRSQFSPGVAYLAAISAVIVAPIVEELLFRGVIQGWLYRLAANSEISQSSNEASLENSELPLRPIAPSRWRSHRAAFQAIFMTSIFFAIVHAGQWPAPIPIFLLSLTLGGIYQMTGSLLASIALHASFNCLSTLLLFLAMTADPNPRPAKNVRPLPALIETSLISKSIPRSGYSTTD
jgi:membrane protease YdiL (CAAX protease family)